MAPASQTPGDPASKMVLTIEAVIGDSGLFRQRRRALTAEQDIKIVWATYHNPGLQKKKIVWIYNKGCRYVYLSGRPSGYRKQGRKERILEKPVIYLLALRRWGCKTCPLKKVTNLGLESKHAVKNKINHSSGPTNFPGHEAALERLKRRYRELKRKTASWKMFMVIIGR